MCADYDGIFFFRELVGLSIAVTQRRTLLEVSSRGRSYAIALTRQTKEKKEKERKTEARGLKGRAGKGGRQGRSGRR